MKVLLRTSDPTLIAFATVLLEGEGIVSFQLDQHMGLLEGWPRRLTVRQADLFRARAILRDNGIEPAP